MRYFIVILSLLFCSYSVNAQQAISNDTSENRLYVGAGLSTTSYVLEFSNSSAGNGSIGGSLEPIITVHLGYNISRRLNLQLGLGYDKDIEESNVQYFADENDTELTYRNFKLTSKGVIVPISAQFAPFNLKKRLQFLINLTIAPTLGSVELSNIERRSSTTTVLADSKESGINVFFVGGILLKYKLSNRFDTYLEGNILYKNLHRNSMYANSRPKSVGIGLQYKFNLSR